MRFHTRLCDVLEIDYPILQSGMGNVAGPELVAEVSRAGGLAWIPIPRNQANTTTPQPN